eukprot:3029674-Amphidinium_carterae.1
MALGVQFELGADSLTIMNTEGRKSEIKHQVRAIIQNGTITSKEASALRGRVQFLESQLWARAGSLCLEGLDVVANSCSHEAHSINLDISFALQWLIK